MKSIEELTEGEIVPWGNGSATVTLCRHLPPRPADEPPRPKSKAMEALISASAELANLHGWTPRRYGATCWVDVRLATDDGPAEMVLYGWSVPSLHSPRTTCAHCGEEWPCTDEQIARAVNQMIHATNTSCAHCLRPTGSTRLITLGGLRWHSTKKFSACEAAGLAAVVAAGKAVYTDRAHQRIVGTPHDHDDHDRLTIGCKACIMIRNMDLHTLAHPPTGGEQR
jgi:hypothetical protein